MKLKKVLVIVLPIVCVALLECIAIVYRGLVADRFLPCWFSVATGWLCPGCGGTRSFYALLDGNLLDSLEYNAFVPLMAVIGILLYCRLFLKVVLCKRVSVLPKSDVWVYIPLGTFILYCILRNIV